MKKILKIGILFLIVFALAVAAFAAYKLLKKDDAPKSDETVSTVRRSIKILFSETTFSRKK